MESKHAAAIALLLIFAVAVPINAAAQSLQSTVQMIKDANDECYREFRNPIKQAVARAACENQNMELLRPSMRYPDLMDQELAYNLVLAEKVQHGKMTMIEREAAAAQFHSQVIAEEQRRDLAQRAVRAQESAANAARQYNGGGGGGGEPDPIPRSDAPVLRNLIPPTIRCHTIGNQTTCQ